MTDEQGKTLSGAIERAMYRAFLPCPAPGWATGLIKQAIRNEERAVRLLAVLPKGEGARIVERAQRMAKAIGQQSGSLSHQDALDMLFDLEWDAALSGEDDEGIKRRRRWLAFLLVEYGIKEGGEVDEEVIRTKAKERGTTLACPAAVDSVDGMTIRERYALEMMPIAAGIVERRIIAGRISEYARGMRAAMGPSDVGVNASSFVVQNLEPHVDEIADQAVIMADALLRRLAQG